MKYSGLGFPKMFNSATKTSVIVTDIDKMKANIHLLLRQQIKVLLLNPEIGTDLESILFADDVRVTRDFMFTFVNDSVTRDMPDVILKDVNVVYKDGTLNAYLYFQYKVGSVDFDVNFNLKGALYE